MLRIGPISLSLYCFMLKMEKQNACNLQIFHDIILFPQIHNAPLHLEPSKKKPVDFNQFFWSGLGPGFQNEH